MKDNNKADAPAAKAQEAASRFADKTVARIRETDVTPTGARVSIEIDWATPRATTVDALDLAEDCVASWRAFFAKFGIAEP